MADQRDRDNVNLDDAGRSHAPESFFQNRACPYFPCHEGVAEDDFNCLFCYCPLYALGERCGGDFSFTESGVKNCRDCALPHRGESGIQLVKRKFPEISALAKRTGGEA